MEADYLWLQLLHDFAHGGVERSAIGCVHGRGRVKPELVIIRGKPLFPCRLAPGIRLDSFVTEEVHVDRRRYPLTDDVDLLPCLLSRQHRTWQRAECPALRRRDHQVRIHDPGHRSLDDGKLDLETFNKSAIWPHGLLAEVSWRPPASVPARSTLALQSSGELCNAAPPHVPAPHD